MADITTTPQWVPVYKIANTDDVKGDDDGVVNIQAKNLADRTEWLNENKVNANDPSLTNSRRCNNEFDDATTARANLDVYSKSETDTKITGLVNSAPETLDTLKELADALGDDPNFAASIVNQIGTKANAADVYTKSEIDQRSNDILSDANAYTDNKVNNPFNAITYQFSLITNDATISSSEVRIVKLGILAFVSIRIALDIPAGRPTLYFWNDSYGFLRSRDNFANLSGTIEYDFPETRATIIMGDNSRFAFYIFNSYLESFPQTSTVIRASGIYELAQ